MGDGEGVMGSTSAVQIGFSEISALLYDVSNSRGPLVR